MFHSKNNAFEVYLWRYCPAHRAASRMLSIVPQEAETRSAKVVPTAKGERVCEIVLADVADKFTGDILHKSRIHVSEEIKGKGK